MTVAQQANKWCEQTSERTSALPSTKFHRNSTTVCKSYLELRVDALVNARGVQRERDGEKGVHLIVLLVDQLNLKILVLEDLEWGKQGRIHGTRCA